MAHPKAVTEYKDNAFTAEQLDILKAEPMLVVDVAAKEKKEK